MRKSDEEIIAQVLEGQKQKFSVLVERYQKQVFNLMYRYCGSDNDAADLTQEAFLRAYEKLDCFKMGHSFFSWLYTLALNTAHDWRRKKNRQTKKHQELKNTTPDPVKVDSRQETLLQYKEDLSQMQQAMQELPDDIREVLILRYNHSCSVKEAAEIFSISESAVKMRASRGLKLLRDIMQGENS